MDELKLEERFVINIDKSCGKWVDEKGLKWKQLVVDWTAAGITYLHENKELTCINSNFSTSDDNMMW